MARFHTDVTADYMSNGELVGEGDRRETDKLKVRHG